MNLTIWLLTIVNLICYLDRYIIASVSVKIESEFGLTHGQTGMFMSAFMIGYVLTCPLFGYLGDRKPRPILMGAGVFVWSLATFASGMVSLFIPLLIARSFVGVGEASFATLSPPFIRDSQKDESTVNGLLGIFYTSIPVGAAIGYMWGGWMAEHYSWRYAFYLGSIPGFALTLFICRMKEPAVRIRQISQLTFQLALKNLWSNHYYRFAVFAYTAQTFALGGFSAWAPQYGVQVLGVSLTESAFKVGASTLVSGIVGTLIGAKWGGFFMDKNLEKSGVHAVKAFFKFCGWSSIVATPLSIWAFRCQNFNEFILAMFLVQTAIFASLAPANSAILAAVPASIAASAFAVSIFAIHALGDVISPPLAGLLADFTSMPNAMLILVLALGLSGIIWLYGARLQSKLPEV